MNRPDAVTFPSVELMNDIWRVFKVDGLFYSQTPCFPMKEASQDPTHVNIMTEDTPRLYFLKVLGLGYMDSLDRFPWLLSGGWIHIIFAF